MEIVLDEKKQKVLEIIDKRRQEIVDLLSTLVKFPSIFGNEAPVQQFIAEKFGQMRLKVDLWEPDLEQLEKHPAFNPYPEILRLGYKNRPVVVGTLTGVGEGRSLILNGHVDVVPAEPTNEWTHDPFGAEIGNGKVYGRGVVDMKGGVASVIMALDAVLQAGLKPQGDLIIESVIDEEYDGAGTLACLLKGYKADAAIVTEPSALKICTAHEGVARFDIVVKGKSTHPYRKSEGVSAIDKIMKIYRALEKLDRLRKESLYHPLINQALYPDPTAIVVGTMRAGTWRSMLPAEASMACRMGYLPQESIQAVKEQFEKQVREAAQLDSWLVEHPPQVELVGYVEPVEISSKAPIARALIGSYEKVTRSKAEIIGAPAGSDMRLLVKYGDVPTVWFGPGSFRMAHAPDESVPIDELILASKIIALTILDWCGF
jgi:acetylornithine deacetylase